MALIKDYLKIVPIPFQWITVEKKTRFIIVCGFVLLQINTFLNPLDIRPVV